MGINSIWDKKCYQKISWNEIENEASPHYVHYLGDTTLATKKKIEKTAKNAIIGGGIVGTSLAILGVISPLWGVVSAVISGGIAIYDRYNEADRRRIEEVYNELFPIKGRGYIGIGEREPWMNFTAKLSLYDIGATGHIIDGIAHGFSLFRAQPEEVKDKKIIDFKNNLYMAGGPIPNAYSRNVLYGEAIQTPFKFRLDLNEKLTNFSPSELKRISYDMKPNWYICDENGDEIEDCIPKMKNGVLIEDSFMIIKCKNIYPKAGKNTKSVIFAGCHGTGTSAAGALIKNKKCIDKIYNEVENNDFQLIGRVPVKSYESGYGKNFDETKIQIKHIQQL